MYPVAYWIAFHGGRFKSVLLFLLLLPFFVSFVIRILAWQFILADDGIILGALKDIGLIPDEHPCPLDPVRGRRRAHLRRAPVHAAAALRRAAADRPDPGRGRRRPLRERHRPLPHDHPAALGARHLRRDRPRRDHQHRRLPERVDPRRPIDDDDRQHHPDPVRQQRRLPDRVGAGADPDGGVDGWRWRSTRASSGRGRCRSTSHERRDRRLGASAAEPPRPAVEACRPAELRLARPGGDARSDHRDDRLQPQSRRRTSGSASPGRASPPSGTGGSSRSPT